jgi:hypothetical protein
MEPNRSPNERPFDRVRAHALGLDNEAQAAAHERELAHDATLREFADDWRALHELTRPMRDEPPTSALTFDKLSAALQRDATPARASLPSKQRRVAAAAAVLIAACATWFFVARSSAAPHSLALTAISLEVASQPALVAELPAELAHYTSVAGGEVQWIDDVATGFAIARVADRPVLLWGMFDTCPLCIEMRAEGLRDEGVLALLDDYVPVIVDYTEADAAAIEEVLASGYPRFDVLAADGAILYRFPGMHDAASFVEHLSRGREALPDSARPPSWSTLEREAQLFRAARDAENTRSFGAAHRAYAELERERESRTIAEMARLGLARIGMAARDALLAARTSATRNARDAELALGDAVAEFSGTPVERDLAAALGHLRDDRRFPTLVPRGE